MYWGKEEEDEDDVVSFYGRWRWWWWRRRPLSSNIETTAYALLTLVADPDTNVAYSREVIKYMTDKQNSRGGYASTQVSNFISHVAFIHFFANTPRKLSYKPNFTI